MNNLNNFPTVWSPTLGRHERIKFMNAQAKRYGIRVNLHKVVDYYYNRNAYKISGTFINESNFRVENLQCFTYCTFISYLECLDIWFNSTNEQTVIVCDDDTDFSTSEYWNFTWDKFISLLPKNWECVQLIRMRKNLDIDITPNWRDDQYREVIYLNDKDHIEPSPRSLQYKLIIRTIPTLNVGGGVFMLTRGYVKKLLDCYKKGEREYVLNVRSPDGTEIFPFPETTMVSLADGTVYNLPLFVEYTRFNSTYLNADIRGESWQKVHENSRDFYYHFWKENSKYTTIEKLMFNEKINYDDPGCKNNRVVE